MDTHKFFSARQQLQLAQGKRWLRLPQQRQRSGALALQPPPESQRHIGDSYDNPAVRVLGAYATACQLSPKTAIVDLVRRQCLESLSPRRAEARDLCH